MDSSQGILQLGRSRKRRGPFVPTLFELDEQGLGLAVAWVELDQTDDAWNWVLWSSNGRAIAMSATPYARKHDALRGVAFAADALSNSGAPVLVARSFPKIRNKKPKSES